MALEVKMTDAEHAAKIKDIVEAVNGAVMAATVGAGLEVTFDTIDESHFGCAEILLLTVSVRRPL